VSGMELRVASPADAGAIAEVHVASIQAAYRDFLPVARLAEIDLQDRTERWRQNLADNLAVTVLSESAGQFLGFVNFGGCRDEDVQPERVGEVRALYVRPRVWGTGVGSGLLREALNRLRNRAYQEATLWVLEVNQQAIGFYKRFGFSWDGATKQHLMCGIPVFVVRLRKHLGKERAEQGEAADWPRE
jgi:GNAT superfamily N-acetyltransferase